MAGFDSHPDAVERVRQCHASIERARASVARAQDASQRARESIRRIELVLGRLDHTDRTRRTRRTRREVLDQLLRRARPPVAPPGLDGPL